MVIPHFLNPFGLLTEFIFTCCAVLFCFLIYRKTKESYVLTRYEGIKYFREAFLFFGIAYLLRFLLSVTLFSTMTLDVYVPRSMFLVFILPLGYFSTVSIFYLLLSAVWKKFDGYNVRGIAHGIAIILSLIALVTRSHIILLVLQFVLLVLAVVLGFVYEKRRLSQIRILYILVFVLWLMNLWILGRKFPFHIGIVMYSIALLVFLLIYRKIQKWVK